MNTKRHIFALLFAILFLGSILPATITFTPANPVPGQMITFTLNPTHSNMEMEPKITWTWADGSTEQKPITQLTATHAYASAGNYEVSARYYYRDISGAGHYFTETTMVRVSVPIIKAISFSPGNPNTCEPVTFQTSGFVSTRLRWDFGDGTVQAGGGVSMVHAYSNPGSYMVRVFDNNGSDANPASTTVPVSNKRSITLLTAQPKTGIPVSFQAAGFVSSCLMWDFGDGQPRVKGTAAANHIYANPGSYQVKALDNCGESLCLAGIGVTVETSQGPLASFAVSYAILRFENGTTSISVTKDKSGLTAYADLKFEGSGFLQAEWRVDGQPFKITTQSLGFANQVTIDSGKIPGLPTTVLGPHTVSLHISKPALSFTIPAISYYVTAALQPVPPMTNALAPVIQTIIPDTLERGKEYVLDLQGMRLTPDTVIFLGTGIAIKNNGFTLINPLRASLAVFVSPTAKFGDRYAKASNSKGANTGPGKVTVAEAPPQPQPEPFNIICTDLNTLFPEEIKLKAPVWFLEPVDVVGFQHTGNAHSIYNQGPPQISLHTIDDLDVLEWSPLAAYDYIEVRFFKAKTNQLLLTKRFDGSATSMPISGAFIMELWDSFSANIGLLQNMGAYAPGSGDLHAPVDLSDIYLGEPTKEQQLKELFKEAQKKADISWQVAAFRVFPCVYNSKKNTPNQFNQTIELGLSPVGLFNLPDRPNGVTCPASGMNYAKSSVKATNSTKTARDIAAKEAASQASADFQGSGTSESIINYIGDTFDIGGGTLTLSRSPYGSQPVSGTAPKIPNLFIDWGDGTGAKPLDVKIDGDKKDWDKSLRLKIIANSPNTSHTYQKAGSDFVIRIFELSENDIQKPAANFLAKLGKALAPPPSPSSSTDNPLPYYLLLGQQGKGNPGSENSELLSDILGRAYMLFCQPVTIYPYKDTCVDQPLKLLNIEIVSFPSHNLKNPTLGNSGQGPSYAKQPDQGAGSSDIKLTSSDYKKYLQGDIEAVAVTCDQGLFATAELTYVGKGSIELLWQVDEHYVEKRDAIELASESRPNLTATQALDCSQALSSRRSFDSSLGVLPVGPGNEYLGMHTVNVLARVVADSSAANLYTYAAAAVLNLAAIDQGQSQTKALNESGQSGPDATPAAAVPETHNASDPLLAAMQQAQAHGQAVPQIGFLNPDPEAEGPAVVYLNDSLGAQYAPEEVSTDWVRSEDKHYQVNEVRNLLGCRVLIPDNIGGSEFFKLTDMSNSIVLNDDDTYSTSTGSLHLPYLTGTGSYKTKLVPIKFDKWTIDPETGIVENGLLNVSNPGASDFQFPSFIKPGTAKLTHLQGGVDNKIPRPMETTFDFDLASKMLDTIKKGLLQPASIIGAKGRSTAGGDWSASGLELKKTGIGYTGFFISSTDVAIDLSAKESPAQFPAAWTGVCFGDAIITPYTLGFTTADPQFHMNNSEAWVLQAGGLNGRAKSTAFIYTKDQGFFKFGSVDFGVTHDVPDGTYKNLAVKAPWLDTVLSGNAVLSLQSNGYEYNTILTLDTHDPVLLTYSDLAQYGRVTMTASAFSFKTATLGGDNLPAVECVVKFDLFCEDNLLAQFWVNDFDFLFDGRALFGQQHVSWTKPLSGLNKFGQSDAGLKQVVLTAPEQGEGRLDIAVDINLKYAKDSEQAQYVPDTPATITYQLFKSNTGYGVNGPVSNSSPFTLNFPLVNPDMASVCKPLYNPQPDNSSSGGSGGTGGSGPSAGDGSPGVSLSGTRFSAQIPLSVFGVNLPGYQATFILGYNSQGSYFLTAADIAIPIPGIPLAPIPFSIYGFKGGFGYNFEAPTLATANVNSIPEMTGAVAFSAGVTLGTTYDNGFTLKGSATLSADSSGNCQVDFTDCQLLSMGNFGGQLKYSNKVFSGAIFGNLQLFDQLSVAKFSLGPNLAGARVTFSFGGGDWFINAGNKDGERITAEIWGVSANGYLMLNGTALQAGGGITQVIPPGADTKDISVYVKSYIDVGFAIYFDPFRLVGDFDQGIGVGGCLPVVGCDEFTVSGNVHVEAPDPTMFKVCFKIKWPKPIGKKSYCKSLNL